MKVVHGVLAVIVLVDFVLGVRSDGETSPALVWWEKEPLIFSENETSSIQDLKGILPEIWPTVVEQCQKYLTPDELQTLKHGRALKMPSALPTSEFSEKLGAKSILMPVKLRKEKDSVLGMRFVKLIDSPGVAVLMKKTLTGTDLLNAILLAWPILIFVILSASLSGFVIWFLVSPQTAY